ncbi:MULTISPECIES: TetR/AcrR family transcriptional regulator [unclassified Streptomyces]|uniref:TetR/AcrR family transcriptional regulator n=1 Tax=unclassified Streptomyces TaxID=2593676 RepID=UPI0035D92E93
MLESVRHLLQTAGYERTSVDGIAELSGVSKPAIYRRWPSKAAIVADAMLGSSDLDEVLLVPNTEDLSADLRSWMYSLGAYMRRETAMIRGLVAASMADGATGTLLAERFQGPARQAVIGRLNNAVQQGTARPDVDLMAASSALMDPLLVAALEGRPLMDSELDGLLGFVMAGLLVGS